MGQPREGKQERNPTIAYRVLVAILGILILGSGMIWMVARDPFSQPLEEVR